MGGKPEPDQSTEKAIVGISIVALLLLGVFALSVSYVGDRADGTSEPSADPAVELVESPEPVELDVPANIGAGSATVSEQTGDSVVVSGVVYGRMGGMSVVTESLVTDGETMSVTVDLEPPDGVGTTVITEYQYSFEIQNATQYEQLEVVQGDNVIQLEL